MLDKTYIEDILEIAYKDYRARSVWFDRQDAKSKTKVQFMNGDEVLLEKELPAETIEQIYKELPVAEATGQYHEQLFKKVLSRNENQRINGIIMGCKKKSGKANLAILLEKLERNEEIWPCEIPYEVLQSIQKQFGNGFTTGSFMQQVQKWRADNVKREWR